jgi:predicted MPP superfamily phosphohydrolase
VSYFFESVLGAYVIINLYMLFRLWATLAGCGSVRGIACALLILFASSFPVGRVFADSLPVRLADFITMMGSLYLSPMIYGFMLTAAADIFRLINGVIAITHNPPPFSPGVRLCCAAGIFGMSLIITLAGTWNANTPVVITHDVEIDALRMGDDEDAVLKIAVLSDIHLGHLTGSRYLKKLVTAVNEQFPDIVLLLGDTIDSGYFFRNEDGTDEAAGLLSSFEARLGTWAILGNHDYYVGADRVKDFLSESNVRLLTDEAVDVEGVLTLVGRVDRAASRYGINRLSIADIVSSSRLAADRFVQPMIVMDHQPFNLEESMEYGAALQLSGHTHRGQIFPFNFIIASIYEKSYGLYKKGSTNYYISSGAGVWGSPVRTVGRPEIVIINILGTSKGGYE